MQNFLALIKFRQKPLKYSFYLSGSFLILCSFYIWASGELAANLANDMSDLKHFELYKGLAFVSLTSALIFILCFIFLKRLSHDAEELLQNQATILQTEHRCAAGVFASCMAHDANNVLAVISLRTEQLKLMVEPESEAMIVVNKLGTSIEKLIAMMTKLKDAGATNLGVPQKFDFKKMVEESIELVSHHKSLLQTKVELSLENADFDYVGYPILFQQMMINLILNAAEAPRTQPSNQIKISLHLVNQNINLNIEDNGTGITDRDKEKIFNAFYTTKKTGSGLGLLSVKACVDQHLGQITIRDSSLGGALFNISIPKSI